MGAITTECSPAPRAAARRIWELTLELTDTLFTSSPIVILVVAIRKENCLSTLGLQFKLSQCRPRPYLDLEDHDVRR